MPPSVGVPSSPSSQDADKPKSRPRRENSAGDFSINSMTINWKIQLHNEFRMAQEALDVKNQGRMRVCARRAAGISIREYLIERGIKPPSVSAYELLKYLEEMDDTPADLRQASAYLRLRVTEEFRLPIDVDLVAEAKKIISALTPDWDK